MKIWGVVGWKNSGKTTLVAGLVSEFTGRGLNVSTIKHAHHDIRIDQPGTDSHRHAVAGASEVLVGGAGGWALIHAGGPRPEDADAELAGLLARLAPCDLILVEGFKSAHIPKIEVIAPDADHPPLSTTHPGIRAYASDHQRPGDLPVFGRSDYARQADFIAREIGL